MRPDCTYMWYVLHHNYHYNLPYCELTKHDENKNEPILGRRMINLVDQILKFLKCDIFTCVQTPKTVNFVINFHDYADSEESGHKQNIKFGNFYIESTRLTIHLPTMGLFVF